MDVDPSGSDDRPGQKQQRVAGEQREDDEPRLRKDDDEQRREQQYGMLRRQIRQGLVEREQRVEQRRDHRSDSRATVVVVVRATVCPSRLGYGRIFSAPPGPVFFSGLTRSSRDTPSHMTSEAMTSAEE